MDKMRRTLTITSLGSRLCSRSGVAPAFAVAHAHAKTDAGLAHEVEFEAREARGGSQVKLAPPELHARAVHRPR
eukprot:7209808-Prymnesium_polylepis.2